MFALAPALDRVKERMCRMLGMVAAAPLTARELLCEAPRSLRELAREHADGWGVAVRMGNDWLVDRGTACAAVCERYATLAGRETQLLIAHVRKKTVGPLAIANTHPFRRGTFVFAHNGTLTDVGAIAARCSAQRLAEIEGDTDSERLFAFVMTRIDEVGDVARGIALAVRQLHALGDVGSASFLLSCGARLYAHRCGRTLYTLTRPSATLIASERLTDEAWVEVPERAVVEIEAARYSIAA
jgi:glutamine amidotransferase